MKHSSEDLGLEPEVFSENLYVYFTYTFHLCSGEKGDQSLCPKKSKKTLSFGCCQMIILCDKKVVSRDCPSGPVVKTMLPLQGT